jgi:transposase
MGSKYVNIDRETPMLLAVDMKEWVAADDLVHFVLEAVNAVEMNGEEGGGRGSEQYPPRMMLALLIYSYAGGVFSSRKIERLSYQDVSVRYLCANTHPDHDTIAVFRAKRRKLFERSFTTVVKLAREMKLVQMGTVHLDGTKLLADASKRKSLDAAQLERELEAADRQLCTQLLTRAEAADRADEDRGQRLPQELADPATRKAKLEAAKAALKERAAANPKAKNPTINLTDPDSRIMPEAKGGFSQSYNAQLAVEATGVIVAQTVCQATNDRAELAATAATLQVEPGEIAHLVVDEGYDNQTQIEAVEETLDLRVICRPQGQSKQSDGRRTKLRAELAAKRRARAKVANSRFGRQLLHERQTTVEPVFGSLKHNLGFRRFHLRGLDRVRAEWSLLTTAYNCRQLWRRALERAARS